MCLRKSESLSKPSTLNIVVLAIAVSFAVPYCFPNDILYEFEGPFDQPGPFGDYAVAPTTSYEDIGEIVGRLLVVAMQPERTSANIKVIKFFIHPHLV